MKGKTKNLGNKFTDFIYWFTGSWWSVIIHTFWFSLWLIFRLNIHVLTLIVSLEAIYLCIFILMATNRAEGKRDVREIRRREIDEKMFKYDIKLDEKADRQLKEITRLQKIIHREIGVLRKNSGKHQE